MIRVLGRMPAAVCLSVVLSTGCALVKTSIQDEPVNLAEACAPDTPPRRELSSPVVPEPQAVEPVGYPAEALRTADILNLSLLLRQMEKLQSAEAVSDERATVQLLTVRQRLFTRLFLVTEEIRRVEAEISCEQGRVQELTDQLQTLKSKRSTIQTLATIIVSGIASIAGGAILIGGSTVSEDLIAIVAGSFATGLGTLTILQSGEQSLNHDRNLLKEIWAGRKAGQQLIPESVWRLLTVTNRDEQSLREQLLDHWRLTLKELGQQGNGESPIFFGNGGVYTLDQLRTRSALLRAFTGTLQRAHVSVEFLAREVFTRMDLGE
jgi:hypothetical protein